jgi:5'-AMP-activated protein kinase catalytic alpha subunit
MQLASDMVVVRSEDSLAIADENFNLENLDREEGQFLISKRVLGEGATSVVKLAWSKKLNQRCAVKIVAKYKLNEKSHRNLRRELEIHKFLSQAGSPSICNLLEVTESNQHYFIFLEYIEGGDLISHIEANGGKLAEQPARVIMKMALQSIQFIHSNLVVHRDIKAENFLIELDDEKQVKAVKLTDFGLADWLGPEKSFSTPCGSPCYAAPEIVDRRPYRGEPTDVWSAGILLYALLIGEFPFQHPSMTGLFEQIKSSPFQFPPFLSSDGVDLLKKMLNRDVIVRITVAEALEHPWFSSLRTSAVEMGAKIPKGWEE